MRWFASTTWGSMRSSGPTAAVYTFDPAAARPHLIGRLAHAVGHASAVTLGTTVYVIGGVDAHGRTVGDVTAIDVVRGAIRPVRAVARGSDAAALALGTGALIIGGNVNGRAVATVRELR